MVLEHVSLRCQDFETVIDEAKEGDLIFADPPYFENGRETFGRYHATTFREAHQKRLANALVTAEHRGTSLILTNGSPGQVQAHFPNQDIFVIPRQSSIAANPRSRGRIQEYIVLSNTKSLDALRQFLAHHLGSDLAATDF